jgi:hypothetical protein
MIGLFRWDYEERQGDVCGDCVYFMSDECDEKDEDADACKHFNDEEV